MLCKYGNMCYRISLYSFIQFIYYSWYILYSKILFFPIFTALSLGCSLKLKTDQLNWRCFSFLVLCKIMVHLIVTGILDLMNYYTELQEPTIMLGTGHTEVSKIDVLPTLISHWSDKY